jgi:hypothetical protein
VGPGRAPAAAAVHGELLSFEFESTAGLPGNMQQGFGSTTSSTSWSHVCGVFLGGSQSTHHAVFCVVCGEDIANGLL